jgi:signal transduction histidine kinase
MARERVILVALYTAAITLTLGCGLAASLQWIGTSFPGFFVMENRVVPSVALEHWSGVRDSSVLQAEILAVDGRAADSAHAVYAYVRAHPAGVDVRYRLRRGTDVREQTIPTMRFETRDYLWFFSPLIANGLVFTVLGLVVWMLGGAGETRAGTTLLLLNLGMFCVTALDLYGPGRFFRIHAATEALVPASLVYLSLTFPVLRLGPRRRVVVRGLAVLTVALAGTYEWFLYTPVRYTQIHNACMVLWGAGGFTLLASSLHAYVASPTALVRKRIGIVALGLLAGFGLPAWVLLWSGLLGGEATINLAAFSAFLFPLSLAYAVVQHDLFEIDAMLRRGLGYLAVTGVVVLTYALLVLGSSLVLQSGQLAGSPIFAIVFSVLMILLFNPIRTYLQAGVDRLFHRTSHDVQRTLEQASAALAATLDLKDIHTLTIETPCHALLIDNASLWIDDGSGAFAMAAASGVRGAFRGRFPRDHPIVVRLREAPRAITIYDAEDTDADPATAAVDRRGLAMLGAELLLPIGTGDLVGFLALGAKRSRAAFTLDDLGFLSTLANQVAVAIRNAQAYREIEDLNVSLEHKVTARTEQLAGSVRALEGAYAELQQSQERLLHAEKMAALGRLTSGIAHEVNTPLGATMNGLRTLGELIDEYRASIGDPDVTDADHREIAAELHDLVGSLASWTDTAAGYIRGIKAHTRGVEGGQEHLFSVRRLLGDIEGLLAHRVRLSSCTLTVDCPDDLQLWGDPGRLSQVVTNLVTNAVDAYDGQHVTDGPIRIVVREHARDVEVVVEDEGCGIAPEHLERIFNELFTTKPQGKGTGLGLSIARDIIADCFQGRLEVSSTPGRGSRFALVLPKREASVSGRTSADASV